MPVNSHHVHPTGGHWVGDQTNWMNIEWLIKWINHHWLEIWLEEHWQKVQAPGRLTCYPTPAVPAKHTHACLCLIGRDASMPWSMDAAMATTRVLTVTGSRLENERGESLDANSTTSCRRRRDDEAATELRRSTSFSTRSEEGCNRFYTMAR
jgi:hypothetical protein